MARTTLVRGGVVSDTNRLDPVLTTSNAFTSIFNWPTALLKTKRVELTVTGNPVALRLMGSLDGGASFPHTVQGSVSVTGSTAITVTDYYNAIEVAIAPATPNSHGTATVACAGVSH